MGSVLICKVILSDADRSYLCEKMSILGSHIRLEQAFEQWNGPFVIFSEDVIEKLSGDIPRLAADGDIVQVEARPCRNGGTSRSSSVVQGYVLIIKQVRPLFLW
jgi:hypothetical protein